MPEVTIALAGNPNTGKTTMFNNLTGARQHVGNWPGVTVEKKWGGLKHQGYDINVVDLPGVYSLTAYSPDEVIARKFVVEERPDVVVDIMDAANLERNLYLAVQFMELGAKLIIVLNMTDVAASRNHRIDAEKLSRRLGVPVVRTVANRNEGTKKLLDHIVNLGQSMSDADFRIDYGKEIEKEIKKLEEIIQKSPLSLNYPSRWLAIKLLEEDEEITRIVQGKG